MKSATKQLKEYLKRKIKETPEIKNNHYKKILSRLTIK